MCKIQYCYLQAPCFTDISRTCLPCVGKLSRPLTSSYPLPPSLRGITALLLAYVVVTLQFLIDSESCSISPFATGLFHLAGYPQM